MGLFRRHGHRQRRPHPGNQLLLRVLFYSTPTFTIQSFPNALQLYVATSPELKGVTGKYFHPLAKLATPLPLSNDRALQQKLWSVSEELVAASKQRRNA